MNFFLSAMVSLLVFPLATCLSKLCRILSEVWKVGKACFLEGKSISHELKMITWNLVKHDRREIQHHSANS